MDFISVILAGFLTISIVGLGVALLIGYLMARWFRGLAPAQRNMITAFLLLVGLVLIVTVVGAGIGAVMVLMAVFAQLFMLLSGKKAQEVI